ncbi:uncharacterized protein LOC112092578 [Morus notabilis]|uniref:uncharacterized protein LOC112092578 n=1 Tax=Morus notabilis TaxID=981085 RepID=UPI000CECFEA8|nr:uncharacterized protein LOC112092578 [Morus notabilis]
MNSDASDDDSDDHYFRHVVAAATLLCVRFVYREPSRRRHTSSWGDFTAIDPHIIAGENKYSPWFDDCVGALDGMHVSCVPPRETAELYRNRKGYFSLNVLAVCSFDMRFTYMLSGWEGSAHDARVLASALDHPRKRFSIPPPGKFYLVDSGYANNGCFMAPYRGTTYHLQEYRNRRGRGFRSERELFNYTHSSLRNVIERTFGVWKAKFRILKTINRYPIEKQVKVPVACAIIHNFIHMYRNGDTLLDQYSQDGVPVADIDPQNVEEDINDNNNHEGQPLNNEPELEMNALRDARTHTMWAVYRNRRTG